MLNVRCIICHSLQKSDLLFLGDVYASPYWYTSNNAIMFPSFFEICRTLQFPCRALYSSTLLSALHYLPAACLLLCIASSIIICLETYLITYYTFANSPQKAFSSRLATISSNCYDDCVVQTVSVTKKIFISLA